MIKSASWNESTPLETSTPTSTVASLELDMAEMIADLKTGMGMRKSVSSNNIDNGVLLRKHLAKAKEDNDSLIDLGQAENELNVTRVSILQDFDPLAEASEPVDTDIYYSR